MDSDFLSMILSIVITVAVLVVTGYIIPTLKQRIGDDKLEEIKKLIEMAVKYAEQVFGKDKWQEKKQAVREYAVSKAAEAGLGLSEKEIDMMIESAVFELKKG